MPYGTRPAGRDNVPTMDDVLFPALLEGSDLALLLLRVWIAILFGTSGWSHLARCSTSSATSSS